MNGNITKKGLYIHMPFCKSFCDFCSFYKEHISSKNFDVYLDSLTSELEKIKPDNIDTIFIGGGTPSCLDVNQLNLFFEKIKQYVSLNDVKEFTIECNPDDITKEKIQLFKFHNINRISLGIQSTNEEIVKSNNRFQTGEMIENAVNIVKENGFNNWSLDFIYNFPNQTLDFIDDDLKFIKKYKPPHISWYSLIHKKGTILFQKYKKPNDENDYKFGEYINKKLKSIGYKRYEISNYAISIEHECLHNKKYWNNDEYYGVGPSAAGFLYDNEKDKFFLTKNDCNIFDWNTKKTYLSNEELLFQKLMMGLRLTKGIKLTTSIKNVYENKIRTLINAKLLIIEQENLRTTEKGTLFLNDVLVELM